MADSAPLNGQHVEQCCFCGVHCEFGSADLGQVRLCWHCQAPLVAREGQPLRTATLAEFKASVQRLPRRKRRRIVSMNRQRWGLR